MGAPRRPEDSALSFREQLEVAVEEIEEEDEHKSGDDDWSHLTLLQTTIQALIKEQNDSKDSKLRIQSLEATLGERNKEIENLHRQLNEKKEREDHLQHLNDGLSQQLLKAQEAAANFPKPFKCDRETQTDFPSRSFDVNLNSPHNHLSPVVTPRQHVQLRLQDQEDLEVPPRIGRLPQQSSTISPFSSASSPQSPTRVYPPFIPQRHGVTIASPTSPNENQLTAVAKYPNNEFRLDIDPNKYEFQEEEDCDIDDEDASSSSSSSASSEESDGRAHCEFHNFLQSPPPDPVEIIRIVKIKTEKTEEEKKKEKIKVKPMSPGEKQRLLDSNNPLLVNETDKCMTARTPYYIGQEMEDRMTDLLLKEAEEGLQYKGSFVEVPKWRLCPYTPLPPDSIQEEEVNEAAFLRRHGRLEADEKRRKRWDSQRVREETYLERLKRRMEERERQKTQRKRAAAGRRLGSNAANYNSATQTPKGGDSDDDHDVESVHPQPHDIFYIRVSEDIPISIFGRPMPIIKKFAFDLPWTPAPREPTPPPPEAPPTPSLTAITNSAILRPSMDSPDSSSSSTPLILLSTTRSEGSSPMLTITPMDQVTSSNFPPSPESNENESSGSNSSGAENNPSLASPSPTLVYVDSTTPPLPPTSSSSLVPIQIQNPSQEEVLINNIFIRR